MASNTQTQVFLLTQVVDSPAATVSTRPESLLPVANRELLDMQLEALEQCGFQSVTLVCPMSVVDTIRSWKSDVCQRKIAIEFHPFADSLDTAEALFLFRDRVVDDFVVIVGSVLFEAAAILQALDDHRAKEPVLTAVMQAQSDRNTAPSSVKKSVTDLRYPANFVGHAADGRLTYIRSNSSIVASLHSSKVNLKKAVLRRFPDMQISTKLYDAQIYVFARNALALADEKRRSITSIRQHLVPFLVRQQFRTPSFEVGIQSLANSMSASGQRLAPELRCFMTLVPPEVFLCRIDSLEDFVHVGRLVAGEAVKSMAPCGVRSVQKKVVLYLEGGAAIQEGAMVGSGCIIGEGAVIEGPCSCKKTTLGRHTRIHAKCKIQTSVTLDHVTLCEGAVVKNSVIGSNVIVEAGCVVENAVIGHDMKLEAGKHYCDGTFETK